MVPKRIPLLIFALIAAPSIGRGGDKVQELARFAAEHRGEPGRGRSVFRDPERAACARCHKAEGEGGDIGPDLSNVGGKLERAYLVEAVLQPSKSIVEGYRPTVLATADGRVVSGLLRGESADRITLVDVEGHRVDVPKQNIEDRRPGDASLMPEGLAERISKEEFADLVAYLEGLRAADQAAAGAGGLATIQLPPGFAVERVATGLTGATALAVAPDSRVLVAEQTGTFRVVKEGTLLPTPFLSLRVDSYWERGLIGVALDPDFSNKGHVYVVYVTPEPYPHHRVSRFTASGDVAAPGSEVVLFEGDDQTKLGGSVPAGHQGGAIHFGKGGKLYVALGEQTSGAPSQDLHSLLGKLLRLNPDGSIPADNPFFDRTDGKYRAIWALGLRNPFTFAVQPGTGRIYVNDVGGVAEEINEGFAGANYGWPAVEHGPTADPRFRGPIHHYPTASIAGGAFCPSGPSSGFPEKYRGLYFFMDFVQGWIHILDPEHPESIIPFANGLARPVDMAFAPGGGLYVLLRDAWVVDEQFRPGTGSLLKILYRP